VVHLGLGPEAHLSPVAHLSRPAMRLHPKQALAVVRLHLNMKVRPSLSLSMVARLCLNPRLCRHDCESAQAPTSLVA
jgi:hypothetical protein